MPASALNPGSRKDWATRRPRWSAPRWLNRWPNSRSSAVNGIEPPSRELQLGCGRLRIPSARGLARDGGDVFDRDLPAARLRPFDLDFGGVAGLLIDLLV